MDSRWAATRRLHAKVGRPPPALHPFPANLPPSAEAVLPLLRFPSATPPTRRSSTGHGEIVEQLLVSSPPAPSTLWILSRLRDDTTASCLNLKINETGWALI
ncbi:hypothetical protein ZWY2020_046418 [Hordeum vulgare]|nr:hypothetical protein ZWY2020_046418 [Hordeum vulgare]